MGIALLGGSGCEVVGYAEWLFSEYGVGLRGVVYLYCGLLL